MAVCTKCGGAGVVYSGIYPHTCKTCHGTGLQPVKVTTSTEGTVGEQGAKGETGQAGEKGPTGDKGLTGDKGANGDKGATGDTGANGTAGTAWPIGSVFISVVSTNPNTLLGLGTWEAIAAGCVLVGINSGDADFDTVEDTGGAKTVQASNQAFTGTASTDIVNHTHDTTVYVGTSDGTYGTFDSSSTTPGTAKTITTGNPKSGGVANYTPAGTNAAGAATSVVQPYFIVYMWKRTA
jgi:hypothetical protein